MVNRRDLLKTALFVAASAMLPGSAYGEEPKTNGLTDRVKELFKEERKRREIDTLAEFSEYYYQNLLPSQEEPKRTTLLYPGSGSDLKQLYLGLCLLHHSPCEEVNFVYTEISEPDPKTAEKDWGVSWYDDLASLKEEIEEGLNKFIAFGLLEKMAITTKSYTSRISGGRQLPAETINYSFNVQTIKGTKRLTLALDYNCSDSRQEISASEKKFFSQEFLDSLKRENDVYWPIPDKMRPGVIYPDYAKTEQFTNADIILSHQCGNFPLLQLDYLRAILQGLHKQRTILTEYPESNYALMRSPPSYRTNMHKLKNKIYGYAEGNPGDSVGIIMLKPSGEEQP